MQIRFGSPKFLMQRCNTEYRDVALNNRLIRNSCYRTNVPTSVKVLASTCKYKIINVLQLEEEADQREPKK